MRNQGIILGAILIGAWLGNHFKLPSGVLTGGMIAGLIAKGIVLDNVPSGNLLSIFSQLVVAYVVVSNSDVATIRKNPQVFPIALGYIIILIGFCLLAAFALKHFFKFDIRTAIYATAPGGLSGMALSMADAGAETPISMMFHLLRLTLILVSTPLLSALFAK